MRRTVRWRIGAVLVLLVVGACGRAWGDRPSGVALPGRALRASPIPPLAVVSPRGEVPSPAPPIVVVTPGFDGEVEIRVSRNGGAPWTAVTPRRIVPWPVEVGALVLGDVFTVEVRAAEKWGECAGLRTEVPPSDARK